MRVAHFDCFSGVSGDMTLAALIDAGADHAAIEAAIASLGLPITLRVERVKRAGVAATYVKVEAPPQDKHRHLHHVEKILADADLTERQRQLALKMFRNLAAAEAEVHGTTVEKVHFHEVGALDSIADTVGVAVGLDSLNVELFTSRSVPTGRGMVQCEHGLMPVPAPATAVLLKGVPLASVDVEAELTTPTGAAILSAVVTRWTDAPAMTIHAIGVGAGTRDFPGRANVLRLLVGATDEAADAAERDEVWVLETNLDDVTGEVVGYTFERLLEAGALDVWATPVQMKKQRPGVMLSVLVAEHQASELEEILFRETGTFGVRRQKWGRRKLSREAVTLQSPWGPVRGKRGAGAAEIVTPEYDDCARLAREQGVPLREVMKAIRPQMDTDEHR